MSFREWLGFRPRPDPDKVALMKELEQEKAKMNHVQTALAHEVSAIAATRKRGAEIFAILDEVLDTVSEEK